MSGTTWQVLSTGRGGEDLVAVVGDQKRIVDVLTDTLLSHLSYEERELVEPMARIPYHY